MNWHQERQALLLRVQKPGRYTGAEWNSVIKPWEETLIKFALIFPDLYEIGQSGLAIPLLYELLNSDTQVLAERVFAPAADLEAALRSTALPLWSLESKHALKDFDILGFSLAYELTYSNVITILNLAGLPEYARERNEQHPLIIGGGICAFNPEPLADCFDLFILGEAEAVLPEFLEKFKAWKTDGKKSKLELLKAAAHIPGIYVPSFYTPAYDSQGRLKAVTALHDVAPRQVRKAAPPNLETSFYPLNPIVPYLEITHDRILLELFRGCGRGCRFCQAGLLYRPVRERSTQKLLDYAQCLMRSTGHESLALTSLSSSDYSQISSLIAKLKETFAGRYFELTLPSLRIDNFSLELAEQIQGHRRTSLTFAVEAGTTGLRSSINKGVEEYQLFQTLKAAKDKGWKTVKLYFMLGLPGETREDLEAMGILVKKLSRELELNLTISLNTFIPKPHSVFQREPLSDLEAIEAKFALIKQAGKGGRVNFKLHPPATSWLEGIMARGDRRLTPVILKAWNLGARMDGWEEHFKPSAWLEAFKATGLDPQSYTRGFDPQETLPWEHLSAGITDTFRERELQNAQDRRLTPDCRQACSDCGICDRHNTAPELQPSDTPPEAFPAGKTSPEFLTPWKANARQRIRLQFSKSWELAYISHLDLIRTWERIVRRADLPVAYSQGFHPHMKLGLALPLALGITSECEWLEVDLYQELKLREIKTRLAPQLPEGMEILRIKEVSPQEKALAACVGLVSYSVALNPGSINFNHLEGKLKEILAQKEIYIEKKNRSINIRPLLQDLQLNPERGLEIKLKVLPEGGIKIPNLIQLLIPDADFESLSIKRTGIFVRQGELWKSP